MKNIEYEYSFKVKSLEPFIKYCENNGYKKTEESKQIRKLFKKEDKTMARITIKENNSNIQKVLDFKEDSLSNEILAERRESLPILFEDDSAVLSIIDFLGYHIDKVLDRTRYVYQKEEVTVGLDSYRSPEIMFVVAVEGQKEPTDNVYNQIKDLI